MSNSDVVEETTKITIIKNATSTNSLTVSATELLFNEISGNTTNEKYYYRELEINFFLCVSTKLGSDSSIDKKKDLQPKS
jgi:hypothetical protein